MIYIQLQLKSPLKSHKSIMFKYLFESSQPYNNTDTTIANNKYDFQKAFHKQFIVRHCSISKFQLSKVNNTLRKKKKKEKQENLYIYTSIFIYISHINSVHWIQYI